MKPSSLVVLLLAASACTDIGYRETAVLYPGPCAMRSEDTVYDFEYDDARHLVGAQRTVNGELENVWTYRPNGDLQESRPGQPYSRIMEFDTWGFLSRDSTFTQVCNYPRLGCWYRFVFTPNTAGPYPTEIAVLEDLDGFTRSDAIVYEYDSRDRVTYKGSQPQERYEWTSDGVVVELDDGLYAPTNTCIFENNEIGSCLWEHPREGLVPLVDITRDEAGNLVQMFTEMRYTKDWTFDYGCWTPEDVCTDLRYAPAEALFPWTRNLRSGERPLYPTPCRRGPQEVSLRI